MSVKVALNHQKIYRFDRPAVLGPHVLRLRPSPHCRTPIQSYALKITPENHSLYWRQGVGGDFMARVNFPEKSSHLLIQVDLIAELHPINPFDFLVEQYASSYPFTYDEQLAAELQPCLQIQESGPLLTDWVNQLENSNPFITTFIGNLSQKLQQDIAYTVRFEPGIQTCEETLSQRLGSCRDTAWLLVQILRHCGLAARFVSGYLIQLKPDEIPLEGPAGPEADKADLHAWAEVYLPGAGWIGLDPTSGMLTAEGHIPLAAAADPRNAEPVTGSIGPCESELTYAVTVTRIEEQPRVTQPYTAEQWQAITQLGEAVEVQLQAADVRLTMGGEPTFVSQDDRESTQWHTGALGEEKRQLAGVLLSQLRQRFAPGGLLHEGQGKWYPGEPLPRWALGCYWRKDGVPMWRSPLPETGETNYTAKDAKIFITAVAQRLGVDGNCLISAYDKNPEKDFCAYVLPLIWTNREGKEGWVTSPWHPPGDRLFLIAGDSPAGFRLPLSAMNWASEEELQTEAEVNPEDSFHPFGDILARVRRRTSEKPCRVDTVNSVKVALSVEVRQGKLYCFMPPISAAENYIDAIASIEEAAVETGYTIQIEGFTPPRDRRLQGFQITPDPGVIEVNLHPAANWQELVETTNCLYEEARLSRLDAEKYTKDGLRIGTGGGSHITLGGPSLEESPLLRRPDLLRSLITYWQHHPSLSYLFSGLFIGATSQSPRVDEGRYENLYELEIALAHLVPKTEIPPNVIDRLLRNLLIDVTGNTHRSEFCVDKLYPVENWKNKLGLLELRGFEMPPHPRMAVVLGLLIRALVIRFWQQPYSGNLVRWGTVLHDRFLLPYYIALDFRDILRDLTDSGYPLEWEWFEPFLEFRFPRYGAIVREGVQLELRRAIEPWYVLGEEATTTGTARYVDSSMERIQVLLRNATPGRHSVTCNGYPVPLQGTDTAGEWVAGVRYRARKVATGLHPAIDPHVPLVFDIVDTWQGRSLGGCTYYAEHPGGVEWNSFPLNSREAHSRLITRFVPLGHTPGEIELRSVLPSREYPLTLDLRRV
ncbi:DUF2126 domain-containing protein [Oscillatoria acuminata]|uniref:Transglutaminase-like domain-containing protein n=1 Tax=Oscillatoria acuminata PCC 6304 TaxID=56110 RepID=K9TL10_9CYAN|nr:transglutaminase family protein [Oscillatoria acuminata]AFY83225.1 hypothetical protein Oscil6304_3664 [Oscillatoria acuminata PCC 6304]